MIQNDGHQGFWIGSATTDDRVSGVRMLALLIGYLCKIARATGATGSGTVTGESHSLGGRRGRRNAGRIVMVVMMVATVSVTAGAGKKNGIPNFKQFLLYINNCSHIDPHDESVCEDRQICANYLHLKRH